MAKFVNVITKTVFTKDFRVVAKALGNGHANMHGEEEGRPKKDVEIYMGLDSIGERLWIHPEDVEVMGSGDFCLWAVLNEENLVEAALASATSGSAVAAKKVNWMGGGWLIGLASPLDEKGEVYCGSYHHYFSEAVVKGDCQCEIWTGVQSPMDALLGEMSMVVSEQPVSKYDY